MNLKTFLLFVCIFSNHLLKAQSNNSSQTFIIRGKVNNSNLKVLEFGKTGFFDYERGTVKIKPNGSFYEKISIEAEQDVRLELNNEVFDLHVKPNDTIDVTWDDRNLKKTLNISSPVYLRRMNFKIDLNFQHAFLQSDSTLEQQLYYSKDKLSDSVKYKLINEDFNTQLRYVFADSNAYSVDALKRLVNKIYFRHAGLLQNNRLSYTYALHVDVTHINLGNYEILSMFLPDPNLYQHIVNTIFYECPEYRDFIYAYTMAKDRLFNKTHIINPGLVRTADGKTFEDVPSYSLSRFYDKGNKSSQMNDSWQGYYKALMSVDLTPIREWMITKHLFSSFENYPYSEAEEVFKTFISNNEIKAYRDTLIAYHREIDRFKSGMKAPDFKLKDENGKIVSLSDFKGKLVYIDFWGVHCPPCIYQIKSYVPELHRKYNGKDVVFLNICGDENILNWKKTLKSTQLDGVNLIAEAEDRNRINTAYRINAIPHYVLIDQQGKFVNYIADLPEKLIANDINIIDKLLEKKL